MPTDREVMQQALDALEEASPIMDIDAMTRQEEAIDALRTQLAKPDVPDEYRDALDRALVTIEATVDSYSSASDALNTLIDWHIAVATDPKVNGGWKLVPVEPTQDMLESGWSVDDAGFDWSVTPEIWKAMLNAAPQPESGE